MISNYADKLRLKLGLKDTGSIDIFKIASEIKNLTLVLYPLGENISGICYKGKKSNLIVINSKMSVGRQRFSLAHEFYHLYFNSKTKTNISFIKTILWDNNEKNADKFASYFLIPKKSLDEKLLNLRDNLSLEKIIYLEQYYKVSHKAMLYRLQSEGIDVKDNGYGIIKLSKKLGYDTSLYFESKKVEITGYYINKSKELLKKGYISVGKYLELREAAFLEGEYNE